MMIIKKTVQEIGCGTPQAARRPSLKTPWTVWTVGTVARESFFVLLFSFFYPHGIGVK